MFGRPVTLFRLFGIAIRVDISWLLILILMTWTLSAMVFPQVHPGMGKGHYWAMGLAGAVALFVSIVLHELAHAFVARRKGIPIKGITLFVFGGVAEMHDEPATPRDEILMAAAGPLTSVALSVLFFAASRLAGFVGSPEPAVVVLVYLAAINLVLALFNLVPAFPMDGGRIFRALLWMRSGDIRQATAIASSAGSFFGVVLVALGIFTLVSGDPLSGLWWIVIGIFVRSVAQASYQQLLVRRVFQGEPISRFMTTSPVTVQRAISIETLVDEFVYRYHHKLFPVVDGERLTGCVTTRAVRELAREEWPRQTVGSITEELSEENSVGPHLDAMTVLSRMTSTGRSRLLVVEGDELVGVVTLKDLVELLSVKIELGGA
jgi:Zn-dependent protease/CBS domain-containing protein